MVISPFSLYPPQTPERIHATNPRPITTAKQLQPNNSSIVYAVHFRRHHRLIERAGIDPPKKAVLSFSRQTPESNKARP
jgi:hypothetical protein